MANKDYCIRIWDNYYNDFAQETQYTTRIQAVRWGKEFARDYDGDDTVEVQLHIKCPALGTTQMVGYLIYDEDRDRYWDEEYVGDDCYLIHEFC